MKIVEIDGIDTQTLKAAVEACANILRAAIEASPGRRRGIVHDPAFGRDHETVAQAADRFTDQLLVLALAIRNGRIEKGDSQFHRPEQRRLGFRVVATAIGHAHAHAAEADRGYCIGPRTPSFHCLPADSPPLRPPL